MRTETSSVAGLPDMHFMGHTCANLNGELFFVWGGTSEDFPYEASRNSDLWIYETLTGYWKHRTCNGDCPPYLSSSPSCIINKILYVFGGHSTTQDNWVNSLYSLNLETFEWRNLGASVKAKPAKPIRSDKNVGWAYEGLFYIFGGYGWSQTEKYLEILDVQPEFRLTPDSRWPKYGWNNQLVVYNPLDNCWHWPVYTGKCPSARAAHSGVLMGDKYYVFGGRDCNKRLNDLYTLDMKGLEWKCVAVVSDPTSELLTVPINHLLEPPPEGQDDQVSGHRNNEDDRQLIDEMQDEQVNHENPSPSSSTGHDTHLQHAQPQPSACMSNSRSGAELDVSSSTATLDPNDDDDHDDDDDDDVQDYERYPHPSHLLERCSLSSSSSNGECRTENRIESNQQVNSLLLNNIHISNNNDVGQQAQQQANDQAETQEGTRRQVGDQSHQDSAEHPPVGREESSTHQIGSSSLSSRPALPIGRSFCSFTQISGDNILLFGGVSSQDKNLDDCWLFNVRLNTWTQVDLRHKKSRIWHTGSRTKQNEIVIIGGSCCDRIEEYCTDVLVLAFEPKSLKRLALDAVSRSIPLRKIQRTRGLPAHIRNLIRLRKQALALNLRKPPTEDDEYSD